MTLSLLALWFLCCERRRIGGENPGRDRLTGQGDLHEVAAGPGPEPAADRRGDYAGVAAEGGGEDLPLARGHRLISTAATAARYELITCQIV